MTTIKNATIRIAPNMTNKVFDLFLIPGNLSMPGLTEPSVPSVFTFSCDIILKFRFITLDLMLLHKRYNSGHSRYRLKSNLLNLR